MTRIRLHDMTVEKLVERFVSLALAQDEALLMDEFGKFNKLFFEMQAVNQELKRRDGDQRRALLRLYDHPNAQVRLKAAKTTFAVAPTAARQMLEKVAASKEFPQAGEAGMSLWNLDEGVYKPT